MQFDMGRAWSEGVAKVRANFSLLAILGGVFFFIPSVVMYLAMPELMDMMMMPGGDAEAMTRAFESIAPQFFGLYLVVLILSLAGYSAMIALIGDTRRLSVGEAIAVGFKATLPLIAVLILFVLAYVLIALVFGLVLGVLMAGLTLVSQGLAVGFAILVFIAVFIAVLMVMTRMSMTVPSIALERQFNPIAAVRRSWQLTRPVQWRLLGFFALILIAYLVIAIVLFMIMGLVVAAVGAPTALGFLNGIVGAAVAMVFSGLLVGIHRQLAGPSADAVRETFD